MESRNMTPTISVTGPQTEAGKRRAERIRQLRRNGQLDASWAGKAMLEVDQDVPSQALRGQIGAWPRVWDRPRPGVWPDALLTSATEDWDHQTERNAVMEERRKEREAAQAAVQRERDAAEAARREQEAEQLKDQLRSTYMGLPGTTTAGFEREYPTLVADHRRHEMERLARVGTDLQQELRRAAWRGMHEVD